MSKKVVILGGGVIGMFSAYYLAKAGHAVTVLDRNNLPGVSSVGNAGMIVPSHVIPMAAPGMISKGIRWMFDSKSPFYLKPGLRSELFSWGWKFYRSANDSNVEKNKFLLRDISLLSKKLYQELSLESKDFEYKERGLLMLFQTEHVRKEEIEAAMIARDLGLDVDILDQNGLEKLDYGVKTNASGAVLYQSDAHLQPNKLMAFLQLELDRMNVEFVETSNIRMIETKGGKVTKVISEDRSFEGDEFVIAAGAWSRELAKLAGESIRLLPGKGYSFTIQKPAISPKIPTILCEGKVAVTPFDDQLRFGGTMEITHVNDHKINRNRVQGIVRTINSFYPQLQVEMPENNEIWMGFRPCSPTGLPYIGRSSGIDNLIFATGHGMMGLSLGPGTGFLVRDLVHNSSEMNDLIVGFSKGI